MMSHEFHTRSSSGTPTARELEVIVRRLWTTEPRCSSAERTTLLTELFSVGLALERIILHDETRRPARPATEELRSELAECERHIRNLLVYWPANIEARSAPLVAA